MKSICCTLALLLVGSAVTGLAQDYQPQPQPQPQPQGQGPGDDTPAGPGRGVARISVINGEVSVRRGDSGEVTAATVNGPLSSGDTLLTSSTARAELQFDSTSLVRIAANSEVRMGDLQYHHNQIQVAAGLVTFTVLGNSTSQNEIDTPSVAVHPTKQGAYRILVQEDGSTEITVRAGQAEIASPKGSQTLEAGQTMTVRGDRDDPEFQVLSAIQADDWDRWNLQRDHELTSSVSRRYVNPDVYGAEDLDRYGHWVNDGTYGNVWTPSSVDPGWAPYQSGRWMWGDDYGWTWVGAEPWGWAPYHYGRWYHASFGWAWWPGPVYSPCYWSPALVGFFGFGGRVGYGFGFGSVGWVPLAPFEPFHRWWGAGFHGGYRNTVIVNNVNVYNNYHNARYGAVMGVSASNFGRGGGRFTAVSGSELRSAGMVRGMLPVTPDRSSLRMADRQVNMSNFRQSGNTQFYSRSGTSQVRSMPLDQGARRTSSGVQSGSMSRYGSQNGSGSVGSFSRGGVPSGSGSPSGGGSWQRFNGPSRGSNPVTAPQSSPSARGAYGGYSGGGLRVSPPMVRERSAPSPSVSTPRSYGGSGYSAPSYSAPRGGGYNAPSYSAPRGGGYNAPSYSAPRGGGYNAPSYSAPRGGGYNAPSYSAPRGGGYTAPSYSAPRGGGYSAPSYSAPRSAPSYGGGGGGSRGGGGGGHASSGGGGGHSSGGGGGGGHHR